MPDLGGTLDMHTPDSATAAARTTMLAHVRAELRVDHARLTDRQIDLIADAAVELRMMYSRLGFAPHRRL